jgi:hypothetical protein
VRAPVLVRLPDAPTPVPGGSPRPGRAWSPGSPLTRKRSRLHEQRPERLHRTVGCWASRDFNRGGQGSHRNPSMFRHCNTWGNIYGFHSGLTDRVRRAPDYFGWDITVCRSLRQPRAGGSAETAPTSWGTSRCCGLSRVSGSMAHPLVPRVSATAGMTGRLVAATPTSLSPPSPSRAASPTRTSSNQHRQDQRSPAQHRLGSAGRSVRLHRAFVFDEPLEFCTGSSASDLLARFSTLRLKPIRPAADQGG